MISIKKHKVARRWCLCLFVPFTSIAKHIWISKRRP
jgi:hypothetical protein